MSSIIEKLGISPAPWKTWSLGMTVYIRDAELMNVAETMTDKHEDDSLIVSAPEMLEVLFKEWKFIESYLASNASRNDGFWYNEFINRQNAIVVIIQKATNKSWEEIKDLLK